MLMVCIACQKLSTDVEFLIVAGMLFHAIIVEEMNEYL